MKVIPLLGNTIHHSDAGSRYTSVRFRETLSLSGLVPSIGSVGDAFDNALAETTIGLYKTEAVRADSPFRRGPPGSAGRRRTTTADWVHWYNTDRIMHRLGRIPPIEYENLYYATNTAQPGLHTHNHVCIELRAIQYQTDPERRTRGPRPATAL